MAELVLATGWTPDACLDMLTPRGAGFLLDQEAKRDARRLIEFVQVIHGEPKDAIERLRGIAFPVPKTAQNFTDSLAAMADALGHHGMGRKIRQRDRALRALAIVKAGGGARA